MGKPAARVGDSTTHLGTPLAPGIGSVNVMIGGQPAWRAVADQHACPAASISGADGVGSVLLGSPTVMINSQMATRLGDIVVEKPGLALSPANPIAMGCPTVMIGEVGVVPPAVVPPIVLVPDPNIPRPGAGGKPGAGGAGGKAGAGKPGAKNTSQGKTMSAAKKAGAPFTKLNCNLKQGKPGQAPPKKAQPRKRR